MSANPAKIQRPKEAVNRRFVMAHRPPPVETVETVEVTHSGAASDTLPR